MIYLILGDVMNEQADYESHYWEVEADSPREAFVEWVKMYEWDDQISWEIDACPPPPEDIEVVEKRSFTGDWLVSPPKGITDESVT